MHDSAFAIVIGGGCIGLSVAYHLARRSRRRIVLLEREAMLGNGSTGLGVGGVRHQFSTEINTKLSMESIKMIREFERDTGSPLEFRSVGYLFLASSEDEMNHYVKQAGRQRLWGVEVELLSPQEIGRRHPFLNPSRLHGGVFCSKDGVSDPYQMVSGYRSAAQSMGVEIRNNTEVVKLQIDDQGAKTVITNHGAWPAENVVIAAGVWSPSIAAGIGIDLPIVPLKRACFITTDLPGIPDNSPFIVDAGTAFWMRKESGGVLMGRARAGEAPGFHLDVDYEIQSMTVEAGMEVAPLLAQARIKHSWAGLYEMTPDCHPIVGALAPYESVFIAAGFSGHGFMHAPAVGKHLAAIIDQCEVSLDISSLSFNRFQSGELITEDRWV